MSKQPQFRELNVDECLEVLARNNVGRLAFSFHDAVDIRPINYVQDNGWIFGRTARSEKLTTLRHNQWVAFEVDEIEGPYNWKSVIARGSFYQTDPGGSTRDVSFHERAIAGIKKQNPLAFTDEDPTGSRTEVFAIHIDSLTGRSSTTEV